MNYSLYILPRAQKELGQLNLDAFTRVRNAVRDLAKNPRPEGCVKLTGRNGWRIRTADYRVIYEIDDGQRLITVLNVGHRRDVYR